MSQKKFGPDRFSRFDVYWIQTDRQTNKQTDKPNLYIDLSKSIDFFIFFNLQIFTFKKNVLRQLLFLEIVSVTKIKNKLFIHMYVYKVVVRVDLKNELLRFICLLDHTFWTDLPHLLIRAIIAWFKYLKLTAVEFMLDRQ